MEKKREMKPKNPNFETERNLTPSDWEPTKPQTLKMRIKEELSYRRLDELIKALEDIKECRNITKDNRTLRAYKHIQDKIEAEIRGFKSGAKQEQERIFEFLEHRTLCCYCGFILKNAHYCDNCKQRVAVEVDTDGLIISLKKILKGKENLK